MTCTNYTIRLLLVNMRPPILLWAIAMHNVILYSFFVVVTASEQHLSTSSATGLFDDHHASWGTDANQYGCCVSNSTFAYAWQSIIFWSHSFFFATRSEVSQIWAWISKIQGVLAPKTRGQNCSFWVVLPVAAPEFFGCRGTEFRLEHLQTLCVPSLFLVEASSYTTRTNWSTHGRKLVFENGKWWSTIL